MRNKVIIGVSIIIIIITISAVISVKISSENKEDVVYYSNSITNEIENNTTSVNTEEPYIEKEIYETTFDTEVNEQPGTTPDLTSPIESSINEITIDNDLINRLETACNNYNNESDDMWRDVSEDEYQVILDILSSMNISETPKEVSYNESFLFYNIQLENMIVDIYVYEGVARI